MYNTNKIKAKLASYSPTLKPSQHDAAVALILREQSNQIELLLIERAIIPGDPWSGQLAFPGGRVAITDNNLCSTAIRETAEETGIILNEQMLIGRLDDETGNLIEVQVACFVFIVENKSKVALSNEVKDLFWCSLDKVCNPALKKTYTIESRPVPAIDILGHERPLLWGLTYRFVNNLSSLLKLPPSNTE